jgi:hypothetical protein
MEGRRLFTLPSSSSFSFSRTSVEVSFTMPRIKQPVGSSPNAYSSSSTGASGGVSLKRVKDENFYRNARDARTGSATLESLCSLSASQLCSL